MFILVVLRKLLPDTSGCLTAEKCPVMCPKHDQIIGNNRQCCHFKNPAVIFSIELYVLKCCVVKGSRVLVHDSVETREIDSRYEIHDRMVMMG